jgi:hypothetical protein
MRDGDVCLWHFSDLTGRADEVRLWGAKQTSPMRASTSEKDPERTLRLFTIRGSFVSKKAPSAEAERANLEVTRFSCALLAFVSTPV